MKTVCGAHVLLLEFLVGLLLASNCVTAADESVSMEGNWSVVEVKCIGGCAKSDYESARIIVDDSIRVEDDLLVMPTLGCLSDRLSVDRIVVDERERQSLLPSLAKLIEPTKMVVVYPLRCGQFEFYLVVADGPDTVYLLTKGGIAFVLSRRSPAAQVEVPSEEKAAAWASILALVASSSELPELRGHDHPVAGKFKAVTVFYGTDREPTGDTNYSKYYGITTGDLRFGRLTVNIPATHQRGSIERPFWFWSTDKQEDHMFILTLKPLDQNQFSNEVKAHELRIEAKDALIFVHGFNVPFEDAVLRTAQIANDTNFPGASFVYSWPSKGSPSPTAYTQDAQTIEVSKPRLVEFLRIILKSTKAEKVHVIAHSMGTRLLTWALQDLLTGRVVDASANRAGPLFNQVLLAAPDIDARVFEGEIAPAIASKVERLTVYVSANDKALKEGSRRLSGFRRVGDSSDGPVIVEGVDTIDASAVKTDFLGHGYIATDEPLLNDVRALVVGGGGPPGSRNLAKREWNKKVYWEIAN